MATTSIQTRKLLTIERLVRLQDEELFFIIERLLTPENELDRAAMTEPEFQKFMADRRRDIADIAERVPGEAVMQRLRNRFVAQNA